jgi:putative Mg2+ transporter-C (MgtC) family protein
MLAGALIGYNRVEHGKAIGVRTTVLVCLAASVSMIEVNLLLPMVGRAPDSFVTNDLMRLPLGILTGVGFIGAGAILRRENLVIGVTTAATIWLTTVIGLCLGAGLTWLGIVVTGIQLLVLWAPKWLERPRRQIEYADLGIELGPDAPSDDEIFRQLRSAGLSIVETGIRIEPSVSRRTLDIAVQHVRLAEDAGVPAVMQRLTALPGVLCLRWKVRPP